MNSSVNCRRGRRPAFFDPILDIVSALRKVSTKSDQAQTWHLTSKMGSNIQEAPFRISELEGGGFKVEEGFFSVTGESFDSPPAHAPLILRMVEDRLVGFSQASGRPLPVTAAVGEDGELLIIYDGDGAAPSRTTYKGPHLRGR